MKIEDIKGKKIIIIEFVDEETKQKTLGFVEEFEGTNGKIVMGVRPLVIKADFQGDITEFTLNANVVSFAEMVKKFESSKHEVLLLVGNKGRVFNTKEEFNRWLESMLHKMVTTRYWQELQKKSKEGYVV